MNWKQVFRPTARGCSTGYRGWRSESGYTYERHNMEEQYDHNNGFSGMSDSDNIPDIPDISASHEVSALLTATVPLIDEQFRSRLEAWLVGTLQGPKALASLDAEQPASQAEGADPSATMRTTSTNSKQHTRPATPQSPARVPSLPAVGGLRRGLNRAASMAMGVVGVALLALLFVGMSALLQSRQPQNTRPGITAGLTPTSRGIRYQSPEEFAAALRMVADWKTPLLGSDSLAWSPDGGMLATAARNYIRVTGEGAQPSGRGMERTFDGPGFLQGIAWSPDGRYLAARQFDESGSRGPDAPQGFVLLLDPNDGLRSVRALSHPRMIISMVWSPDGSTLATTDGIQITLWDVDTGKVREEYSPDWPILKDNIGEYLVTNLAWSPDGLLAASHYRTVKVWDTDGWKELASLENPGGVIKMGWSLHGSMLGVVAVDESNMPNNVVVVWDATISKELRKFGPFPQVSSISWSTYMDVLAVGVLGPTEGDNRVQLLDPTAGRHVLTRNMTATDLAWSPDGNTLAVAESRGSDQTGLLVLLSTGTPRPDDGPAPTPTAVPAQPVAPAAATSTAIASMTVVPVPTEVPGMQATLEARATASPYPTAQASAVQTGQPSIATVRRGGLTLEVRLDDNRYLAGENGQALITIRSTGSERLYVGDSRLALLALVDELGEAQPPWPPMPANQDGWGESWPGWNNHPPFGPRELQAGGVISSTFNFQVPDAQQAKGHTYGLRAEVTFSRARPDGRGSDGIMLDLQAQPLPIQVSEPQPIQHLKADLRLDQNGYTLLVTDGAGQAPAGPFWGAVEARFSNGRSSWLLPEQYLDSKSQMAMPWPEHLLREVQANNEIKMRVWVAAKGHVPAVSWATLPGSTPALPGAVPTSPANPPMPPAPPAPVLTPTPVPPVATATAAPIEPPTPATGQVPDSLRAAVWNLRHIEMVDQRNGWGLSAVGEYPNLSTYLLRTSDGGRTWDNLSPHGGSATAGELIGWRFLDANTGWVVAGKANTSSVVVLHTTNGGAHWQRTTVPTRYLFVHPYARVSVDFLDGQRGWMSVWGAGGMSSSQGQLFATEDGGQTWTEVASTEDGTLPFGGDVRLLNRTTGWLAGSRASTAPRQLYVTRDGGKTWSEQKLMVADSVEPPVTVNVLALPTFFSGKDEGKGVLPALVTSQDVGRPDQSTVVFITSDGGQTWKAASALPYAYPGSSFFLDANHWWVWGAAPPDTGTSTGPAAGKLRRTLDGEAAWSSNGADWETVSSADWLEKGLLSGYQMNELDFVSPSVGFALLTAPGDAPQGGRYSLLLRTTDGGRSWSLVEEAAGGAALFQRTGRLPWSHGRGSNRLCACRCYRSGIGADQIRAESAQVST